MLSKKNRFTGPTAVKELQQHGASARSGPYSIKHRRPRYSPAESKVAVIVSKKVDKRAVVRNKIRRRLFEIIRTNWQHIDHPVEMSIGVFEAKTATLPNDELEQQIIHLLQKAGVWKAKTV